MKNNYTSEFIDGIEIRTDTRICSNLNPKQIKILSEISLKELVKIVKMSISKDISEVMVVKDLSERIWD